MMGQVDFENENKETFTDDRIIDYSPTFPKLKFA